MNDFANFLYLRFYFLSHHTHHLRHCFIAAYQPEKINSRRKILRIDLQCIAITIGESFPQRFDFSSQGVVQLKRDWLAQQCRICNRKRNIRCCCGGIRIVLQQGNFRRECCSAHAFQSHLVPTSNRRSEYQPASTGILQIVDPLQYPLQIQQPQHGSGL